MKFQVTRLNADGQIVAQFGNVGEDECKSLVRLAVGHPYGGWGNGELGTKLSRPDSPMHVVHLPPPLGSEAAHTLTVKLEPAHV